MQHINFFFVLILISIYNIFFKKKTNYIVIKVQPFNVWCPLKGHKTQKNPQLKAAGLFNDARPPNGQQSLKD